MAMKIMIDAGHGGYDNGATYNERREKDDTLRLALAVGEELVRRGVEVDYTRTDDSYQNPNEKARIANQSGADYFLSLHRNTSPISNTYAGVETLIFNKGDIKEKACESINSELSGLGFYNLGTNERTNIAVLRKTKMPSILIEVGYINTDSDNALFDEQFYEIANSIAQGLLAIIRKTKTKPFVYRIQVGLFRNYSNAENLQQSLEQDGFPSDIIMMGEFYSVVTGGFNSIEQAGDMEQELREKGYETFVIAL
jgi:N-acetylmuramoyl-L-alanine amidase